MSNKTTAYFSVVTPIYNAEMYLEECIQSVIKQSFEDWQLVLVDDGSEDGSGKICDQYAMMDQRIRVVHQKNSGELHSRDQGIKNSDGKYVLQLDADDYLEENALELLWKKIEETDCDIIAYRSHYVGKWSGGERKALEERLLTQKDEILRFALENHSMCDKAIRLALIKDISFSDFDRKVRFSLDYAQSIPLMCSMNSCYITNYIIYNYRIHDTNISACNNADKVFDICKVNEFVWKTLKESNRLDDGTRVFIAKAFLKEFEWRFMDLYLKDQISCESISELLTSDIWKWVHSYINVRNIGVKKFITISCIKNRWTFFLKLIRRMIRSI